MTTNDYSEQIDPEPVPWATGIPAAVDAIIEEFVVELQRDGHPAIDDYLAKYPQYAHALETLLPAAAAMASLGVPSVPPLLSSHGELPKPLGFSELGDFRILRELGRGGMGIVYEAEQISLGRRVALKVLPFAGILDARQLQRFKNEARAAATLDHPNIVHVHAVGQDRGVHYFAMQLIEGQSLADVVALWRQTEMPSPAIKKFPKSKPDVASTIRFAGMTTASGSRASQLIRQAIFWGIQAARALEFAHQTGVIHRDIKPSNLLVNADGQLWITDFGLAMTRADTGITMTGDILGTFRYMSPEQILGRRDIIDHRTDIYSLGITLYELLALCPAFLSTDRAVLIRQVEQDDPPESILRERAVPAELQTIIYKAISKDPSDRYATASELADDLQRYLDDRPIVARKPSLWNRAIKWSRRHRTFVRSLTAAAAISLLAAMLAIVFVQRAQYRTEWERMARFAENTAAEIARKNLREQQYVTHINLADRSLRAFKLDNKQDQDHLAECTPELGEQDLRGFEWHYLAAWRRYQVEPKGHHELEGHETTIYDVKRGPDDNEYYSCGMDGIRVWNARTDELLHHLTAHTDDTNSIGLSPDGRWMVSTGDDFAGLIWDRTTWSVVARLPHGGRAIGGWFTPDARSVLTVERRESVYGTLMGDNQIHLWETESWKPVSTWTGPRDRIYMGDLSDDGRRLVVGDAEGCASIFQVPSGNLERTSPLFSDRVKFLRGVEAVDIGHRHRWLVAAGRGRLSISNIETGETLADFPVTIDRCAAARFSENDGYLAIAGEVAPDWGIVQIWKLTARSDYELVGSVRFPSVIWAIDFLDRDEILIAGKGGIVSRWKLPFERLERRLTTVATDAVSSAAVSPDGKWLARTGDGLEIHPLENPESSQVIEPRLGFNSVVAFSSDGKLLARTGNGITEIWTTDTWQRVFVPPAIDRQPEVRQMHFMAENCFLCFVLTDGAIARCDLRGPVVQKFGEYQLSQSELRHPGVWFEEDGPDIFQLHYHGKSMWLRRIPDLRSYELSPDSSMLAIGFVDGNIEIYETATGKLLTTCSGHRESVVGMAFSPDIRTMAYHSEPSCQVTLCHIPTARQLLTIDPRLRQIRSLFFTPDGRHLVVAGQGLTGHGEVLMIRSTD